MKTKKISIKLINKLIAYLEDELFVDVGGDEDINTVANDLIEKLKKIKNEN